MTLGYTVNGMVLSKREYFSERKKGEVYSVNLYDGRRVVSVSVPEALYSSLAEGETINMRCHVGCYLNNGRAELYLVYVDLV